MTDVSRAQAEQAKRLVKEVVSGLQGVVGIGLTKVGPDWAVKVNLAAPPVGGPTLPTAVHGVAVCFEVVGRIQAPLGMR
jgi:hypothetical protein